MKRSAFSVKLTQFAKANNLSNGDLADKLKISCKHLNIYLSGRATPDFKIISKLGKLGCDLNWLVRED